jgi:hypothetical protein
MGRAAESHTACVIARQVVGGGDDAGMAKHLLDHLQIGVRGQGKCGGAVPQVVQPDRR